MNCPTTKTITYKVPGTSQLLFGVPGVNTRYQEGKKTGKGKKERRKKMKTKKACIRSGIRPSPEGTRLLFAGDTVSPMMCPADGQQKNNKKARRTQPR